MFHNKKGKGIYHININLLLSETYNSLKKSLLNKANLNQSDMTLNLDLQEMIMDKYNSLQM